jgi:hypothetical protein
VSHGRRGILRAPDHAGGVLKLKGLAENAAPSR